MSEENLLFEIKPKRSGFYYIMSHLSDIGVFIIIMIVIRNTTQYVSTYNNSIFLGVDYGKYNYVCKAKKVKKLLL